MFKNFWQTFIKNIFDLRRLRDHKDDEEALSDLQVREVSSDAQGPGDDGRAGHQEEAADQRQPGEEDADADGRGESGGC